MLTAPRTFHPNSVGWGEVCQDMQDPGKWNRRGSGLKWAERRRRRRRMGKERREEGVFAILLPSHVLVEVPLLEKNKQSKEHKLRGVWALRRKKKGIAVNLILEKFLIFSILSRTYTCMY